MLCVGLIAALAGDMVLAGLRAVEAGGEGYSHDGYYGWGMEKVMGVGESLPLFCCCSFCLCGKGRGLLTEKL